MIQKIDKKAVQDAVQMAYDRCKNETGGKNADYIPYLADVPSNLFGIAACLADGDVVAVGDTDYKFGIESVSKVPTAILAMNQYGGQEVLGKIGADATGLPFNSIMAILLENDHPSTPLVNAGAISACSMIKPVGDSDGKWKAIVSFIADLAGSDVAVIDELYKSETATNFNNKSIAWLLKNYNRIYDDPDMALDIYTRQCSIGVTARQLATMAATIANSGVNPVTGKAVFKPELTPKIASMMATVGFYEHTGDWLFTTGLPAKTGVGGGIMGVVPGVMGVAAFAPPLDGAGNSVKAQKALAFIAGHLNLNVFGTTRCVMADQQAARRTDTGLGIGRDASPDFDADGRHLEGELRGFVALAPDLGSGERGSRTEARIERNHLEVHPVPLHVGQQRPVAVPDLRAGAPDLLRVRGVDDLRAEAQAADQAETVTHGDGAPPLEVGIRIREKPGQHVAVRVDPIGDGSDAVGHRNLAAARSLGGGGNGHRDDGRRHQQFLDHRSLFFRFYDC